MIGTFAFFGAPFAPWHVLQTSNFALRMFFASAAFPGVGTAGISGALSLALAGAASATPVTYTYTSGDVVITNISLDGVSVLAGSSSPEFGFTNNSTATIDTQADTLAFLFNQ